MVQVRRGQLDSLLDVELVLPRTSEVGPGFATMLDSGNACAATRPPAMPLAAGVQLGKYRLERPLGAGGMGLVWEARDTDLDRAVAVKVLSPALDGNDVARSRLVREARAMARLHHPNVITIYDALTVDDRDVIAMELVDGETMAKWLKQAPPPDAIVAVLVAAGRGLAGAHAAGMVHRDFKPHNILVDRGGRVVVTDFGLARAVGDRPPPPDISGDRRALATLDSALTAPGTVLGTPAYMAPEQLIGSPADARADQFAFCTTAWEALTGERPFPGLTTAEVACAQATALPAAADRVPRRLRPILERGLARDPAARWPSIEALLDALLRAWRRPRRLALIASVGSAVIAVLALVAVDALRAHRAPWQPRVVDLPAFEENGDGPALSPDGTQIAYASDRDRAGKGRAYVAALPDGEPRVLTPLGEHLHTPRWTRDGTALLLVRLDPTSHRYRIVRQPIAGGPYTDLGTGMAADDCGDAIAIADADHVVARLVLQYPDGTRRSLLETTTDWLLLPRCDRAGQRIVFTRSKSPQEEPLGDVVVIDRAGKQTALTQDRASLNGSFTPDGRSVVYSARRSGKVELFEIPAAGGEPHQLTFDDGPHQTPDVSSDGRTVVFNVDASAKMVIASGAGGATRNLTTMRQNLESLVLTRDGTYLLAQRKEGGRNEVVVIATSDGSERVLALGHHPFPSLDDQRVLFGSPGDPPRLLAIPITGGEPTTVADLPGHVVFGTDGPDGQDVTINHGGAVEAWRVRPGGRVEPHGLDALVLPAPAGGWTAVQTFENWYSLRFVAPGARITTGGNPLATESERATWLDDHRIAYAAKGAFHIVDVTTGAEVATLPGPEWGQSAVIAADGAHWYDLQTVPHVTRHLLVNFADRPWR